MQSFKQQLPNALTIIATVLIFAANKPQHCLHCLKQQPEQQLMPLHDLEVWMWTEACDILNRADRLQRYFFKPVVMNAKRAVWEPPIDVYETVNGFKIMIALPGVASEHVKVMLENDHLLIVGQRRLPDSAQAYIKRLEIPYGIFERRIELPIGHFEIDTREFVNGCLIISLRKI